MKSLPSDLTLSLHPSLKSATSAPLFLTRSVRPTLLQHLSPFWGAGGTGAAAAGHRRDQEVAELPGIARPVAAARGLGGDRVAILGRHPIDRLRDELAQVWPRHFQNLFVRQVIRQIESLAGIANHPEHGSEHRRGD